MKRVKTDSCDILNGGAVPLIAPDLLAEILVTASDFALILSALDQIVSVFVNPQHRSFGQLRHWEGLHVNDVLAVDSVPKLTKRLEALRETGVSQSVELSHAEQSIWGFPVRYSLHRLGPDNTVLLLGRDLRPIAEMQQKLVAAQLALERDYEAQREIDTRYRVLMEATRDAIVLVSMATGRIVDLNGAAALVLGAARGELMGAAIAQEFEGRRRGEFLESMANLAVIDSAPPVELTARRSGSRVVVVPTVFRAAGEQLLLCRLETPATRAPFQDELGDALGRLFHDGVDAIVFTDPDGLIRCANDSFLNLTSEASAAVVRGKSLADYLARGEVDLRVLLDNARRTGQMRLYATKLNTAYDGQVAVDISATWLKERPNPCMALVIRDAGRADSLRRPGMAGVDEGAGSVMELVGSSTLKDIVAETTEVVEKMCIETAVELTRNNRVAAAEMLGLSRQSLYVKLRKYGLVNKEEE
ncbi:transcriptional regulator PpsR [Phaeovulum veldkampii]|uniref:transcriptional regulator PpsR n=1 Tax=Phaeovulum veldkampii TaxID=33049 RepID=UPI0010D2C20E|nr:transcriptional regulator PpsR [Phaeovulum veldkampii]TDQ58189.1 transcriptional regulator PpsR [Phaeovulum veldkampii DSM 11550]